MTVQELQEFLANKPKDLTVELCVKDEMAELAGLMIDTNYTEKRVLVLYD